MGKTREIGIICTWIKKEKEIRSWEIENIKKEVDIT
jgi:hypothetical protein